jgi:hypothetical protein
MNFKQLVLEALSVPDIQVWRASDQLLQRIRDVYPYTSYTPMGWKVKFTNPYSYTDNSKITCIITPPEPDSTSGYYIMYFLNGKHAGYKKPDDNIIKAIKNFELKYSLSSSTKETFGGLIDEL